jgi:hypothetical protein
VTRAFDFALGLLPVTAFTCLGASQPPPGEIDQSAYPLASPSGGRSHGRIRGGSGVFTHSMGGYAVRLSACVVHFPRSESSGPVHAKTSVPVTFCGETDLSVDMFTRHTATNGEKA